MQAGPRVIVKRALDVLRGGAGTGDDFPDGVDAHRRDAAGEGGYARELTEAEREQQQQALENAIKGFDVVITTALVPGRPAPR